MENEFTVFGKLDICVARDPENRVNGISKDEYLGISLTGPQWESIFYRVLHCPEPELYVVGEDLDKYHERFRSNFQNHLHMYPMLGRIWNIYDGVNYMPHEVEQFRDECKKVLNSTSNLLAIEGLNHLIIGCNKALELDYGLVLDSD